MPSRRTRSTDVCSEWSMEEAITHWHDREDCVCVCSLVIIITAGFILSLWFQAVRINCEQMRMFLCSGLGHAQFGPEPYFTQRAPTEGRPPGWTVQDSLSAPGKWWTTHSRARLQQLKGIKKQIFVVTDIFFSEFRSPELCSWEIMKHA